MKRIKDDLAKMHCEVSYPFSFIRQWLSVIIVLTFLFPGFIRAQQTWAARLGFPAERKVLLLHIDDAGMCPEANTATQQYIERNQIMSAAVMIPCSGAETFIKWVRSKPAADIGVHLTLTSEWKTYRWGPVSDRALVPGLLDATGMFYHDVPEVVKNASASEVEKEIRAQIEKSIGWGHRPTHIDTHMGTLYGSPAFVKSFIKVAQEYNIPANIIDLSVPEVAAGFKREGYPITGEVITDIGEYRLPKLDYFSNVPKGATYAEKRENFFEMVNSLQAGLTEIIFHPAILSENLKSITGSWQQRVWEGELFADPVVHQFFEKQGIIITNWKDIMTRFEQRRQ